MERFQARSQDFALGGFERLPSRPFMANVSEPKFFLGTTDARR